jgi:hypothetical protein
MGIMNGAINMWKKMCSNLLIMSRKTSNFVEQAHTERKAYNNLIRQQSVLLDEYEDLIKAYDENNKKAGSDTNSNPLHTATTSSDDSNGVD